MNVNQIQKFVLAQKMKRHFGDNIRDAKIAIWGLAFKPNTDDIREAPSLYIIQELLDAGAKITAFDPEAMDNVKAIFGDQITFCDNQYEALEGAQALAIITEWSVFRTPDFPKMEKLLAEKVIFDGRNLYELEHMRKMDYHYESIGRAIVKRPVSVSQNGQSH